MPRSWHTVGVAGAVAVLGLTAVLTGGDGRKSLPAAARLSRTAEAGLPALGSPVFHTSSAGVQVAFAPSGVQFRLPGGELHLSLAGVGRLAPLVPSGNVTPVSARGVVSYRHGQVVDAYSSRPLGLEQRFTIDRRPPGSGAAVTIALRVAGSLSAHQVGQGVVFTRPGGTASLLYGGVVVRDASGRQLPASVSLHGGSITLGVDDAAARYPLSVDPVIEQAASLVPTGAPADRLSVDTTVHIGTVALSADGSTAVLGDPGAGDGTGVVWVFVHAGSGWKQAMMLAPPDRLPMAGFGASVAVSGDGSAVLVGAPRQNATYRPNGAVAGAAWVFSRSGSAWVQQGPPLSLPADDLSDGGFGASVALSRDGSTAVIGGTGAWAFSRSGSSWAQQGPELRGSGESADPYGYFSVALSADGSQALIGSPKENGLAGAAWLFARSGEGWVQQGPEISPGVQGAEFGESVGLSEDGSTALIGDTRGAWAFAYSGGSLVHQGPELTSPTPSVSGLGGVSLSGDGSTAMMSYGLQQWLFTRSGSSWAPQGALLEDQPNRPGTSPAAGVGTLSADGSTALTGTGMIGAGS